MDNLFMSKPPTMNLSQAVQHLDIEDLVYGWLNDTDHTSGRFEKVKLDKIAEDVASYMAELSVAIDHVLQHENNSQFYHEVRDSIKRMTSVMGMIDKFLREAFLIVDSSEDLKLVSLLHKLTVQSIRTKKQIAVLTKRSNIAFELMDLRDITFCELKRELVECEGRLLRLKATPSSFFSKSLPVESLSDFLLSTSYSSSAASLESGLLFVFTEEERTFSQGLIDLESRLRPGQVSIDMFKHKLSEVDIPPGLFAEESEKSRIESLRLESEWIRLSEDFVHLKNTTIGTRLICVFENLNSVIAKTTDQMIDEVQSAGSASEAFGLDFKRCSAAVNLVCEISSSEHPGLRSCTTQYNSVISPRWRYLNELLQEKRELGYFHNPTVQPLLSHVSRNDGDFLRPMKMNRSSTPSAEEVARWSSDQPLGLGINLNLDIKPSPPVPFSIKRSNRIVDLNYDSHTLSSPCPQQSIMQSTRDHIGEYYNVQTGLSEEQLSLPSTPAMFSLTSPVLHQEARTTETTPFYTITKLDNPVSNIKRSQGLSKDEKTSVFEKLRKFDVRASQIPVLAANYLQMNLPVLRKKYRRDEGPSRIPTISPDNDVFCSPERRPNFTPSTKKTVPNQGLQDAPSLKADSAKVEKLESPPAFLIAHKNASKLKNSRRAEGTVPLGDVTNKHLRASQIKAPARKVSLINSAMPNLAFSCDTPRDAVSPVSWRSTSPERPCSSMGSRFDEQHLTQPLKHQKKAWK
ncbi:hypothetical protein OXX79_009026 [Metschnikowia pulcherrima]